MTKEIRIELDSVTKWRNTKEYRTVPRARCEEYDMEVVGDGLIVKKLIRDLYEQNPQISGDVMVFRSGTLCFTPAPIKSWVFPIDKRPEWLRGGGIRTSSKSNTTESAREPSSNT